MGKIKDMRDYVGTNEFKDYGAMGKALLAEFLGTMILVFVGCGSCVGGWTDDYQPSTVQIALAFGVTVATMAQAIGHISGCHINPAVTCGMLVARYTSVLRALCYIIAQCLGGIVGAAILKGVTSEAVRGSMGMTMVNSHINPGQALGIELVITFVLVLTVFGVCDERRTDIKGSAPLAIGLSITTCHLVAVPITGASMNPARSFGPAVVTGIWANHWVYWAGPILGGLLAAIIYTYIFRAPKAQAYDVEMDSYNKRGNNPQVKVYWVGPLLGGLIAAITYVTLWQRPRSSTENDHWISRHQGDPQPTDVFLPREDKEVVVDRTTNI